MKYKIWGGLTFKGRKQVRTLVATKTKKKAMELLKLPYRYFTDYWCATSNEIEIKLALTCPEKIFYVDNLTKEELI